jgi:hypothetical protein
VAQKQLKDEALVAEATAFIHKLQEKGATVQVQLKFTRLDGSKVAKIITVKKPISTSRFEAEADIDSTAIALQCIHNSARLAQAGKYNEARINNASVCRLLQRGMKSPKSQKDYLSFVVQAEVKFAVKGSDLSQKLDQFMRETQGQEAVFGGKEVVSLF